MAERSVQLDININGNEQVENLNDSLKNSTINAKNLGKEAITLTKGIAAGFQLASQAAGAFGEENEQALQKSIKSATQYLATAKALKDVSEGFGSASVKGLKDTVSGFLNAGKGAKIFGIALTSTGIGAIVVGIGLAVAAIAANWEDVVKFVTDFVNSIPFLKAIVDKISELGGVLNIVKASIAAIVGFFKSGTSAAEEFDKAIAKGKALNALKDQEKALEKINEERERSLKLLQAEGDKEQEIFNIKKQIEQDLIKILEERRRINGELSKEEQKNLDDAINNLKVLEAQEIKYQNKVREEAARTAAQKAAQAKTELERQRKIEEDAIKQFEDIQKEIKRRQINLIQNEEKRLLETAEFNKKNELDIIDFKIKALNKNNKKELIQIQELNKLKEIIEDEYQVNIEKIKDDAQKKSRNQELKAETELIKKRIELFTDSINDFVDVSKDNNPFSPYLESLTEIQKKINELKLSKFKPEGLIEAQKFTDLLNDKLRIVNNELIKSGIQIQRVGDYFKEVYLSGEELASLNFENFLNQQSLEKSYGDALKLEREYVKSVLKDRENLTEESIKQYRLYLQTLREETGESRIGFQAETIETLDAIFAYVQASAEAVDNVFKFVIQQNKQKVQELQSELQKFEADYQESVNNRLSLENELKTAEGARRIEILNSIQKEKAAELSLADKRKEIAEKQADLNHKIAIQEWQNAVTNSAVLTAGAILNALNTVPPASFAFAAVAAAISALQTSFILANKPKRESFAVGGFTGIGNTAPDSTGERPVGIVHEKEWVSPRWMVESDKYGSIIQQLEEVRQRGFAEGGFTTPVITDNSVDTNQALIAAIQRLRLNVGVTEFNTVQSRVTEIQERASL